MEAKEFLARPAVEFAGEQALAVGHGFATYVRRSSAVIYACAILPPHCHLVVARHRYSTEQTSNLLKGAATRDEFNDPHLPPFAAAVWPDDAAARMQVQTGHSSNERADLPTMEPMVEVKLRSDRELPLPAIGARMPVRGDARQADVVFGDGSGPAGLEAAHGAGRVLGWGFMPMLAYGRLAGFKPTTLEEKWPAPPRAFAEAPLEAAGVTPAARVTVPVVEASLLTGDKGWVLNDRARSRAV